MGCDIHAITQIRKQNRWATIKDVPSMFFNRNYMIFGVIADVRNSGEIIYTPKGLPEDLKEHKFFFESTTEYYRKKYEHEGEYKNFLNGKVIRDNDPRIMVDFTGKDAEKIIYLKYSNIEMFRKKYSYFCYKTLETISVADPTVIGGTRKEVPFKKTYSTFENFMLHYAGEHFDNKKKDWGFWNIDFDCVDFHSHSYLNYDELRTVNLEDAEEKDYWQKSVEEVEDIMAKYGIYNGKDSRFIFCFDN